MPLTGDARALGALQRSLKAIATPGSATERRLLAAVRKELKPAVQAMYASGDGPDGAWKPRADGKAALRSRKLAGLVAIARVPGGLVVAWRRAWMLAQDEGHTWPARAAKSAFRFYDAKGRRIRLGALSRRALRLRFVEQRGGTVHTVGARVLPARHQKPRGALPSPWIEAIGRGAATGLAEFAESAAKP